MDDAPFITFRPAVRQGSHVIVALYGMSGSGKTLSALLLGRGLVGPKGRLGMIDTETGRGLIYAKRVPGGYEYSELTPPFSPERYTSAIKAAEAAGFDAVIIDSASHLWEGIGGLIEAAEGARSAKGKELQGLAKWAGPKARYKKFIQAMLTTRMHLILCLRAKERFIQDGFGADAKITSGGFVPVNEKSFVYDATVQIFMPHNVPRDRLGTPVIEKCPEDLLGAFPEGKRISIETGDLIREWVAGGAPIDHEAEAMRRAGEEAAGGGKAAFAAWWNRADVKTHRAKLRPFLANFQSIAQEAEEEIARQKATAAGEFTHVGGDGQVPEEDPFATPDGALPATSPAMDPVSPAGSPPEPPPVDAYAIAINRGRDGQLNYLEWRNTALSLMSDARTHDEIDQTIAANLDILDGMQESDPAGRKLFSEKVKAIRAKLPQPAMAK